MSTTPGAQFLGDSLDFLRDATRETFALLDKLLALRAAIESETFAEGLRMLVSETREVEASADLPYLIEQVPNAFERCATASLV